jgi:hypothetical protein
METEGSLVAGGNELRTAQLNSAVNALNIQSSLNLNNCTKIKLNLNLEILFPVHQLYRLYYQRCVARASFAIRERIMPVPYWMYNMPRTVPSY